MSNYIVLVKQVPDVSQITDNAFDLETGTLIRTRLKSVINELDTQALAMADQMKHQNGDEHSKIICLTMGPPMAQEVLKYALGRRVDDAVLLTDKTLGGADTVATANPLAFAVKKIVREFFNNNDDYYVICGMQSVDGDTAQVPPQIAEELNLPCIAYVTDVAYKDNRFEFTGIIAGGSQTVAVKKPPAVITVAEHKYPLFATFADARKAEKMDITQWNSPDINAELIGVNGSKTSVIRVFPPGKSIRKKQKLENTQSLAKIIQQKSKSRTPESARKNNAQKLYRLPKNRVAKFNRSFEATKKENEDFKILSDTLKKLNITDINRINRSTKEQILDVAGKHFHKKALDDMLNGLELTNSTFKGDVWVVAEHDGREIHPATFELIGKAAALANSLGVNTGVCLAGANLKKMTEKIIHAGPDKIYLIEHQLLEQFDPAAYRKAVADCIGSHLPQIVLFAATPRGRMLAPMVSYRLGCGLTADCTSLDITDRSRTRNIGILLQTRPALGGNVMASICTKNSKIQMATARPGVFKMPDKPLNGKGKIIKHKIKLEHSDRSIDIIKTSVAPGEVNLNTEIIVSGGKGMQNRDNYEKLVGSLCEAIKQNLDVTIEKGASRAAVEHGLADRVRQVGQTGTAVKPKIYIALGISGAIQHMIGIANAETIIAVNSDPNAPIFKQSDYYIVGTVEQKIPELVKYLNLQNQNE